MPPTRASTATTRTSAHRPARPASASWSQSCERAAERLDDALCVDLDSLDALPAEAGGFDAMVFGDVLEHLCDPERLLRALLPSLTRNGVLICSIPNVKHWTITYPLLAHDRFTYDDAGLLDRTHVRLFTIQDFGELLERLGLQVVRLGFTGHVPLPPRMQPLIDVAVELGADRAEVTARLGAYQYLVVEKRAKKPHRPEPPKALPDYAADPAARRVLEVDVELDGPPADGGPYDAMIFAGVLERVTDPAGLVRSLLPSLASDGAIVCAVPDVKHWSVVYPLLDYAAGAGGEREETALRLDAYEYFVVARRAQR